MKPGGYIKRHTRLKARRPKPRRSARQRDTEYMLRVKELPCCAPWNTGHGQAEFCSGPIEAHHAGKRAAGRKADDDTCIPFCQLHHRRWHGAAGAFHCWTREQRRSWADARIAETQAKLRPRTFAEDLAF